MSRTRMPDLSGEADKRIQMIDHGATFDLRYYTRYKGHDFDGWISTEGFRRAEADGVLSWDESGNPVIRPKEAAG
jgi:hypothetical protein